MKMMPKAARIISKASGCKALRDFIEILRIEVSKQRKGSGILAETNRARPSPDAARNQVQSLEKNERTPKPNAQRSSV
jgi:hypothetical protein